MARARGRDDPERVGPLDDRDLAADIALLGEVMAAVARAARELTDTEVDEVLGVDAPHHRGRTPIARHTAG